MATVTSWQTLLPENWSKIFGYLDFESLQFKATLVCKDWYTMIRNNVTLSSKLLICPWPKDDEYVFKLISLAPIGSDPLADIELAKPSDINPILKIWRALRILNLRHFKINAIQKLDFKPCKNLNKVYIDGVFGRGM